MPTTNVIPFAFDAALVRVVLNDVGEPWFVAKDVASALGYAFDSRVSMLFKHVPSEWKGGNRISTLGGMQEMLCLSEQGLYFFLGRSDKAGALPFQKWLAGEVLPGIRKTGGYTLRGTDSAGAALPAAQDCAIPNVPELYAVPSGLRLRIWQEALQTARLDNAGSKEAARWFVELCRMVATGHAPRGGTDETTRRILHFAEQKCRLENGGRISARALYDAFTVWWCAGFDEPVPSQQLFGRIMSGRYVQRKRGGQSFYFGVKLAAA